MTKTHDVIATIRKWTGSDGTKHSTTMPVGAIFISSKGSQVLKIDALPLSREWSGWLAIRPCAPALMPKGRSASPGMPPAPGEHPPGAPDPDGDKPF